MTRIMFDGIDPATVPAGARLYAGYVNGSWQSYAPLAAKFPNALHVSIAVNVSATARVLDVETGDATPAQAPGWVEDMRRGGNPYPVVYCNTSTWPAVRAEFAAQHVAEPLYWLAEYVEDPRDVPALPSGAVALQYYDFGGYDISIVADYWPGLDPAPVAPTSSTIVLEEDPVQIEPKAVHPGDYAIAFAPDKKELVFVADGDTGAPAELRVAVWTGNNTSVIPDLKVGGNAGHTVGHPLPAGCTGVTIKRQDAGAFAVGVAAQ